MKLTGICPKCGSNDILRIEGNVGMYGSGNHIPVGITRFSAVKVHRYLCCSCGYSEEWINQEDIPKIENAADGFWPSETISRLKKKE